MNYAVILAGGTGIRMQTKGTPKQFLELYGKPIIVYTLEKIQECTEIDYIVIVCVNGWGRYLQKKINLYNITKVKKIILAGSTRQESVRLALEDMKEYASDDDIVVIHESVRPMINSQLVSECIDNVRLKGSTVVAVPNYETIIEKNGLEKKMVNRQNSYIIRTPQGFYFKDLYDIHRNAFKDNRMNFIDEPDMMIHYGMDFNMLVSEDYENIKITKPDDFYIFKALYEMRENLKILGLQ